MGNPEKPPHACKTGGQTTSLVNFTKNSPLFGFAVWKRLFIIEVYNSHMKKHNLPLMSSILVVLFWLSSCSIEKRTYNKGYHLDFLHSGKSHSAPTAGAKPGKPPHTLHTDRHAPGMETLQETTLATVITNSDLETSAMDNPKSPISLLNPSLWDNKPQDTRRAESETPSSPLLIEVPHMSSINSLPENLRETKDTPKKIEGFTLLSWLLGIPGIALGVYLDIGAIIMLSLLTIAGLTIFGFYRIASKPEKWKGKFLNFIVGGFVLFISLSVFLLGLMLGGWD